MVKSRNILLVVCLTLASYCPETHRYAYKNGDFCCQENREADTKHDGCSDQMLTLASTCCNRDLFIKCDKPPCANSFYDEIDQGKDPITFFRRKGIFVSHEIQKDFTLVNQKFPVEVTLGYPFPKIDRQAIFPDECDGIKSLSFNFNTILRKIIKSKLKDDANETNYFHYETEMEHTAHLNESIDVTGHVIIHTSDGTIAGSHPGNIPLAPPFNI